MAKAILWKRNDAPQEVKIIDKDGVERSPNMEKLLSHPTVRGAYISDGRYAQGVGRYFYGGKLGTKAELLRQGNEHTTNDEIMRALGYEKTEIILED